MKKILTILGAIGLTATTSATVMSCATKKAEVSFKDLTSVDGTTWKGNDFGGFSDSDFDTTTVGEKEAVIIKNKAKIAAYVGAGFNNYRRAYDKILANDTIIIVYRKQELTNEFIRAEKKDLVPTKELFFQLTDSTIKKSAYLRLNFISTTENIFDFETWFNSVQSPLTIKIKEEVEDVLPPNSPALEKMQNLRKKIVTDWFKIKQPSAAWPLTDGAINDFLNYLGEYLVQIKGYVSAYSQSEPPVTIKQQLKNALNQNKEGKDDTRQSLFDQWRQMSSLGGDEPLPLKLNSLDNQKSIIINLSFKD